MDFFHVPSIVGGLLIGVASVTLLFGSGRIAGISGLLGGLVEGEPDRAFRIAFLGALVAAGLVASFVASELVPVRPQSALRVIIAGLFVGFGTRLGSGCTSGHGICGVGRMSKRSLASTCTFVGIGMLTAYAMHALPLEAP